MRHGIDFFSVFLFDQREFGKFVVKFGKIFICFHPGEFRLLKFEFDLQFGNLLTKGGNQYFAFVETCVVDGIAAVLPNFL